MTKRNQKKDLDMLANAFFANLEITPWEYGGIGLDPKRPFGDSDVLKSMLEIIGWAPEIKENMYGEKEYSQSQLEYVDKLYKEKLIPYLRLCWRRRLGNTSQDDVKAIANKNREELEKGRTALKVLKNLWESIDEKTIKFCHDILEIERNWSDEFTPQK